MKVAMHCARCERMAAIRMRHHRLALCGEHYLEWFTNQTARTIQKFQMFPPQTRILVAVSGGKDSLSLWDALSRQGYQADGLYINLGIEGPGDYSNLSEDYAQRFADQHHLSLHVTNVKNSTGHSIPELARRKARGDRRPCAVCGLVKRHFMNRLALEGGYDVLVTAHNLDDETAVLLGNTLSWQVDLLHRQDPVLPARTGFVRKAKPFCRFYERETLAYAVLRGIDFIEDECPFAEGSKQLEYKHILNKLEEDHPGAKVNFYTSFQLARKKGLFSTSQLHDEDLGSNTCTRCGQLTARQGLCAFCQLIASS